MSSISRIQATDCTKHLGLGAVSGAIASAVGVFVTDQVFSEKTADPPSAIIAGSVGGLVIALPLYLGWPVGSPPIASWEKARATTTAILAASFGAGLGAALADRAGVPLVEPREGVFIGLIGTSGIASFASGIVAAALAVRWATT